MDMTLESLMASLEKQAGLAKVAEDESKKDDKEEKKDEKESSSKAKEELGKAEKDFPFTKKEKEEEEDEDNDGESSERTKEAQAAGAELADVLMQKVASAKINKESQMNKQASVAGKALAEALLTKLANAGDVTTQNGIPAGVAPNKVQMDTAVIVADNDHDIKPMPTKDAIGNGGGTINQIFDAIVADSIGQGAVTPEQLDHSRVSESEGAAEARGTTTQVPTIPASVEKTAAVMSLVNSGIDFDAAVDMVKAAAAEIEAEEAEQVKQAAFNELVQSGVDFDLAVALVKSASKMEAVKGAASAARKAIGDGARAIAGNAQEGLHFAKQVVTGKDMPREVALGALARNRSAQVAAGAAAAGAAGAAYAHQKKAAVDALCAAGVNFDEAVALVQAKANELYGA